MSQRWITPTGTIANLLVGVPVSIELESVDLTNAGATPIFTVIQGSLPTGLTLSSSGLISGTPTWPTPSDTVTLTYNFVIRLNSSDNTLTVNELNVINPDRSFTIILSNVVNGDFAWVTPGGSLGLVPNNEYYNLQLQAESAGGTTISYSFVSGELPPGMQLLSTGYLTGVPTFLNSIVIDQNQTYKFTVRATNSLGQIIDRSFNLTITNVSGPIIHPTTGINTILGVFFDGTYYSQQLTVQENTPNVQVEWNIIEGALPDGLSLDQNGLISGYIQPLQLVGTWGPAGFDGDSIVGGVVTEQQDFDLGPYDFNQLNQSLNYSFSVQAFDGANYDTQKYTLEIVARSSWTADSLNDINDSYLTVDAGNVYIPVLEDPISTLPVGRQSSHYAYKFQGHDFNSDTITYSIANVADTFDSGPFDPLWDNTFLDGHNHNNDYLPGSFDSYDPLQSAVSNLPGLLLDATTGWLYGNISPQASSYQTFSFGVVVSKTVGSDIYTSQPKFFTLPVAGDINNIVEWVSPADLGSIDNGSVSELSVIAKSPVGAELIYTLVDDANIPARLPQGLSLLSSGNLSGRVSFEAFALDDYACTFDGGKLSIDREYTFTVIASTNDATYNPDGSLLTPASASATRTFTLMLNIIDINPYVNLYLKAMPAFDQRQIFNSIVSNTEIFDPDLIYRPNDPWFGVNTQITMLFLSGLNAAQVTAYEQAIALNHWTKKYNFGSVKTAVVLDEFYNKKYEVVYIDIQDPEENELNKSPALSVNLTGQIANPYIANGVTYPKVIYPNNSENMITRLEQGVGYYDQSSLPPWMTSNQPDPTNPNRFFAPLGFTKAVVLAYTVPGASKLIAYRLNNSGINFNNVEFSVDRYQVDNYYTSNFNVTSGTFSSGKESTFDVLPKNNVGALVAEVNYGVNVPYSEINGRPVSYINAAGGIDGSKTFADGETIVFLKQEQFTNAGPYDGWVNYTDAWIGDNTTSPVIEGYDQNQMGVYDAYTVIPGYLEKIQGTVSTNNRGGVWKINILNGIVFLTFVLEVEPNQRIQLTSGKNYASSIVYYNPILIPGMTVPFYTSSLTATQAITTPTTFNGGTTKFFSNRDQYYAPGTQDKYLKFPQYGVFK